MLHGSLNVELEKLNSFLWNAVQGNWMKIYTRVSYLLESEKSKNRHLARVSAGDRAQCRWRLAGSCVIWCNLLVTTTRATPYRKMKDFDNTWCARWGALLIEHTALIKLGNSRLFNFPPQCFSEGTQALPARPSCKRSINMKMSMDCRRMILTAENRRLKRKKPFSLCHSFTTNQFHLDLPRLVHRHAHCPCVSHSTAEVQQPEVR